MNIGLDKDPGSDTCQFNTSIFKGFSKLSGWTYFGDTFKGGTPQFCTSNYDMIIDSVKTDSTSEKLDLAVDLVYWQYYLEDTCRCSRVNDSETTKVIIWMPRTPYKGDDYTMLTNNSYNHYVIHFGFTPDVSGLKTGFKLTALLLFKVIKQLSKCDLQEDDLYYKLAHSKNRHLSDQTLIDGDKFTSEQLAQEMWTRICRTVKHQFLICHLCMHTP
uniref:Glyco_tran_10_N domain-containing protein n=1 Tax=Heterorhabditis bacteriophora TaxID=37862 RepID=A0A1I7XDM3_HETBA